MLLFKPKYVFRLRQNENIFSAVMSADREDAEILVRVGPQVKLAGKPKPHRSSAINKIRNSYGRAVYTADKSESYAGKIVNGQFHDTAAIQMYVNGSSYCGSFVAGRRNGHGRSIHAVDGQIKQVVRGEIFANVWHGQIEVRRANGSICAGKTFAGVLHGKGKRIQSNGTLIDGSFFAGDATVAHSNGVVEKGVFFEGYRHGNFTTTYPDGTI